MFKFLDNTAMQNKISDHPLSTRAIPTYLIISIGYCLIGLLFDRRLKPTSFEDTQILKQHLTAPVSLQIPELLC